MSLKNIKLIFRREMRDQLRDRRTLFMILVLPVLFYPLLGISFFQIAQFLREHPSRVLIIGYESTGGALPELVKQDQFAQQLTENAKAGLVEASRDEPLRHGIERLFHGGARLAWGAAKSLRIHTVNRVFSRES